VKKWLRERRRWLRRLVGRFVEERHLKAHPPPLIQGPVASSVEGPVRISLYRASPPDTGEATRPQGVTRHRHVWFRGPHFDGVQEVDLRGFLDGRYYVARSQSGQVHVRMGRGYRGSKRGEWEIFRVLQRWSGVWLPPGASVTAARLEFELETGINPREGVEQEMEILLYNVLPDWTPGPGGLEGNNDSEPAPGEAWWNEVGRGVKRWGLPGAGLASDSHPDADTPAAPLALARFGPGDRKVILESPELTAYVQRQVIAGESIRFLLKLSDHFEDATGTVVHFYSSCQGDSENAARRPRLVLDWCSDRECAALECMVRLEPGRRIELPPVEGGDEVVAVAVSYADGSSPEWPRLAVRSADSAASSDWMTVALPQRCEWSRVASRVDAVRNPIELGQAFTASFRDTWIPSGAPERQEVPWSFHSPSGRRHRVQAEFVGDWTWTVRFQPEELGRWEYSWSQTFDRPWTSAVGSFDVVPGDQESLIRALNRFIERVRESGLPRGIPRLRAFSGEFQRLQRGLMASQTPESFPLGGGDASGGEVGRCLDEARKAMGGEGPERPSRVLDD
jgi:hypothetical protein